MKDAIKHEINRSLAVKQAVLADEKLAAQLENLAVKCISSIQAGGKIIFCGNGGSFADAQHLSAELVSRLRFDRAPLASVALGTNNSNLTAIGNDYGYEKVFERELLAIGSEKDVFIPISTSGNSPNVICAIEAANNKGIYTMGLTGGSGGKMAGICDCIIVPDSQTDKIQEIHIMLGHILCHLLETGIFKK